MQVSQKSLSSSLSAPTPIQTPIQALLAPTSRFAPQIPDSTLEILLAEVRTRWASYAVLFAPALVPIFESPEGRVKEKGRCFLASKRQMKKDDETADLIFGHNHPASSSSSVHRVPGFDRRALSREKNSSAVPLSVALV